MFKYLPLSYLFASRLLTKVEKISWAIIYPGFLFFVIWLFDASVLHYIIVFLGVMAVYEIGYLYNDFVTVKNEDNPTVRKPQIKGFNGENFFKLRDSRLIFAVLFSVLEFLLFSTYGLICFSLSILVVYYLHNSLRNRFNVLTYFFLVSQRYIAPMFFLSDIKLFLFILFIFPVVRTIEHSCKIKYRFDWVQKAVGDIDRFRVVYYSCVLIIVLFFYFLSILNVNYIYISLYFLLFRVFSYLVRNKVKRQKHSAYKN